MVAELPKKVYFARNTETGGMFGLWDDRRLAETAVSNHSKEVGVKYEVVEKDPARCPYCEGVIDKDTLNAFGMCMRCEKIRNDPNA